MNPEQLLQAAREAHRRAAEAKGRLAHLEHFRRHLLAKLMLVAERHGAKSLAKQERDALASEEYLTHLQGLEAARVEAALAEWGATEASTRIELWRTQQANLRQEKRAYGT